MNLIRRGEINVHEKTVKKESSLTEGTPGKVLLKFALPVIFSMIATQFYALADSMIVGKMLGGTGACCSFKCCECNVIFSYNIRRYGTWRITAYFRALYEFIG